MTFMKILIHYYLKKHNFDWQAIENQGRKAAVCAKMYMQKKKGWNMCKEEIRYFIHAGVHTFPCTQIASHFFQPHKTTFLWR